MRWETGSAKALQLEWLWENCRFFLLAFYKQTFSDSCTATTGVYHTGLKSPTAKKHWKSSVTFGMRTCHSNWVWGKKDTHNVCCQFQQCGLRLHLLRCQMALFSLLEWGWLRLTRPIFRELSQLTNFQVHWKSQQGQEWRENISKFLCMEEAGLPGGFQLEITKQLYYRPFLLLQVFYQALTVCAETLHVRCLASGQTCFGSKKNK